MSKIQDLKSKINGQKVLLKKYQKTGNEKLVSKMKKFIEKDTATLLELEKQEKLDGKVKEKTKKTKSKSPSKSKNKLAGGWTKAECQDFLKDIARQEGLEERRKSKNIASGRADSDGSLKASASLDNQAESLENKVESGQTLNKTEQKSVGVNIDKITTECVKMIKTKKDAAQLIRSLVRNLNSLLDDIQSGEIGYEG